MEKWHRFILMHDVAVVSSSFHIPKARRAGAKRSQGEKKDNRGTRGEEGKESFPFRLPFLSSAPFVLLLLFGSFNSLLALARND